MGVNGRVKIWSKDFCPDKMLNHHLYQNFKLIGMSEFHYLIDILTNITLAQLKKKKRV